MKLEQRAKKFARLAHRNQVRKYTGEPYITHPEAVVGLVRSVPHTEEMICAAWLHDTVEDTAATIEEVGEVFGWRVAALVEQLTDVSKLSDGNRGVRKAIDREHTAKACADAQTIKLADLIHNTISIVEFGKDFAPIYLKEKRLLLDVLVDGSPLLLERAVEQLNQT